MRLGIVEAVSEYKDPVGNTKPVTHYLPHHGVVRMSSQTTKLRVVYDGSARAAGDDCSLNDCLQKGPNYIPKLFDVLIQFRWHSIAVTADIEKTFLMVGIKESDRDLLHFLWLKQPDISNSEMIHLHFARLVFGLRPSPAILGAVINYHLTKYKADLPELVFKIESSLYVDDLVVGADSLTNAIQFHEGSKRIMSEAGMNLRK